MRGGQSSGLTGDTTGTHRLLPVAAGVSHGARTLVNRKPALAGPDWLRQAGRIAGWATGGSSALGLAHGLFRAVWRQFSCPNREILLAAGERLLARVQVGQPVALTKAVPWQQAAWR